jgi:hypothetical protein
MVRRLVLKAGRPLPAAVMRTHAGVTGLPVADLAALMRATSGGGLILRRRTMALTGRTNTETSGSHMTLGREALDYDQGPVTGDQVREQEAPEAAEKQAGSSPSAAAPPKTAVTGGPSPPRRSWAAS